MQKSQMYRKNRNTESGGYHDVCIEISGKCNAKCKYCPSGSQKNAGRGIMNAEKFEKILSKLIAYNIVGQDSHINLFWWGEPFLNPNLKDIIQVTQNYNIPYILSTNAFFYQKLKNENFKNIKRLIISLPGFSQMSYNRIHQFDFKLIKENIQKYVKDMKDAGQLNKIWVAYHIYQFNLDEIFECYHFCQELGISFNPGYAFPLLAKERIAYAENTLEDTRKNEILREIITFQLDKMIENSDRTTCVYQKRNFIVDEEGGVFGCLNLEHNEENYCGNILEDNINQIFDNITKLKICTECIKCGVAPTDMSFKFFYDSWFQMMKIQEMYDDIGNEKIDHWENDKQKIDIIVKLRAIEMLSKEEQMKKFNEISKDKERLGMSDDDLMNYIDKYAMRPRELKNYLNEFWNQERN